MLRNRFISVKNELFMAKPTFIERTLTIAENLRKRRNSLVWGFINFFCLIFFLFDLSYKCPFHTTIFNYFEYAVASIFALNTIYHCLRYFYFTIKTETITLTPTQKKLLEIKDDDSHFKITDDHNLTTLNILNQSASTVPASPLNDTSIQNNTHFNWSALSWRSENATNDSMTSNYSVPSPSWVYQRGSPEQKKLSSLNTTPQKLIPFSGTSGVDFISDEKDLTQYLDDFERFEKVANASNPIEQPTNLLSSFWSHPATQNPNEISPFLRRTQYQLSSQTSDLESRLSRLWGRFLKKNFDISVSSSPGGKTDENRTSLNISSTGNEVWRKLQIDPQTLTQWNANLRMWISQTILDRLVGETNFVNEEFAKYHLNDVRVGSVGLDRLRKTAQTAQVIQHIPTLTTLLPFLEVSPNQEYLVKRIKDLAKGGCMSEFKWNSGGSYNGKEWDDNLVNDSEIIIHLLATYLDCQLVPLPNQPDAKPFSKEHFIRSSDKLPRDPITIAIHQVTEKPPHFRLIVGEEVYEVPKGHNNLFYTILLFLFFVNKKEHGMLGKVNMGRSGVNMLWIIEEN